MPDYRFSKSHEWIADFGGVFRMGITDFAQSQLGDITFVEIPDMGATFSKGEMVASIESVKAVSEYFAPIDIKVVGFNKELEDQPELVNSDPAGKGFFLEVEIIDPAQLTSLMDQATYDAWDKEGH